jgi:hypothetical protein
LNQGTHSFFFFSFLKEMIWLTFGGNQLITGREAKELLRWRSAMRALNLEADTSFFKEAAEEKKVEIIAEKDSDEELADLADRAERREKKAEQKRRLVQKKKAERASRGMDLANDRFDFERDEELFDLEAAMSAKLGEDEPEMTEKKAGEDEDEEDRKKMRKREMSFAESVENYLDTSHAKSKRKKLRVKVR